MVSSATACYQKLLVLTEFRPRGAHPVLNLSLRLSLSLVHSTQGPASRLFWK